jgi:hypothetical protein
MPIPVQPPDVDQASWYAANCWPSLPRDRIPGIFAFSQIGEILTVCATRDGENWMRLNAREEEQRWNILNSTMAVLSTSRKTKDRSTLEQFQSLVQPTQFLEQVRRTWPMSETQLDAVTSTVHEMMLRRLDALDVLHKGGQKALDKFMGMTLTGMERKKALAIAKGKKSEVWNNGNNWNNGPSRKRARRGGGGGAGSGGGVSVGGALVAQAAAAASRTLSRSRAAQGRA